MSRQRRWQQLRSLRGRRQSSRGTKHSDLVRQPVQPEQPGHLGHLGHLGQPQHLGRQQHLAQHTLHLVQHLAQHKLHLVQHLAQQVAQGRQQPGQQQPFPESWQDGGGRGEMGQGDLVPLPPSIPWALGGQNPPAQSPVLGTGASLG